VTRSTLAGLVLYCRSSGFFDRLLVFAVARAARLLVFGRVVIEVGLDGPAHAHNHFIQRFRLIVAAIQQTRQLVPLS